MKAMIDFSKGWGDIEPRLNSLINRIRGSMVIYPLCCSTAVLNNVGAQRTSTSEVGAVFKGTTPYGNALPPRTKLEQAKTIWEMIRLVETSNPYFLYPDEVGMWYLMSLIRAKVESGRDDIKPANGYSGFKASQITMFDRLLEDKDPKKGFNFQYNMIFSVDHFQQWLSEQEGRFGEVYLSPPVPGAHKARVRGCVFTPTTIVNMDSGARTAPALAEYENERVELLRAHMLANYDFLKASMAKPGAPAADAIAATW